MERNVIRPGSVDWWDIARCVYFEMDRIYIHPISFVQAVLKHIMVFLKYFLSQFGTSLVSLANPFFG